MDLNDSQKSPSPKRSPLSALFVLLTLFAVAALVLAGVTIYRVLNPKTLFDIKAGASAVPSRSPNPTMPPAPSPEPTALPLPTQATPPPSPTPEPTPDWSSFENTSRLNILLMGLDGSPERGGEGYNSDTMILVSLDLDKNNISMFSIPRDSYVPIYPDGHYGKINSAYGSGGGLKKDGFEYACETVQALFGVKVHHYAGFNMPLVKEVVEAMGGVEYDVDIRIKLAGRVIEPGPQRLDGQQVLDYCRFRSTPQADIGRVARQQSMLKAVFKQLISTGQVKNLPAIYNSVSKNVHTNLSLEQITALCIFIAHLTGEDFETYTVPGAGVGLTPAGYYGINNKKFKQLVEDVFGINFTPNPATDIEAVRDRIRKSISEVDARSGAVLERANTLLSIGPPSVSEADVKLLSELLAKYNNSLNSKDYVSAQSRLNALEEAVARIESALPPPTPEPTLTPMPTSTPEPTSASTPTPISTPQPTPEHTPEAEFTPVPTETVEPEE